MEIKILPLGHIQTNCYLIEGERGAVVIDPGFDSDEVTKFLFDNKDKERLILLTHAHFDHIGGAPKLRETTNTPIAIGEYEAEALSDPEVNLSSRFHTHFGDFEEDRKLCDGDEIKVGDLCFKVIFTPGHTKGGVSYLSGENLFSGDTLFLESIGRTDFPGGDFAVLKASIEKLYALPQDTKVFPGHGEDTTIRNEKKYNPFVRV